MYAVVGCGECGALWVVEGRPETTGCPRCGKRHRFDRLRKLAEADDEADAKQARAALLAERQGASEAFRDLDPFADMEARLDDAGVGDEEYLDAMGVDPDEVAETGGRDASGSRSRRETVLAALRELDSPTEHEVVEYATARGVPADYARKALEKLVRAGDATESGGRYRLL